MILMGNRKVEWEGEGREAFPCPDSLFAGEQMYASVEQSYLIVFNHINIILRERQKKA